MSALLDVTRGMTWHGQAVDALNTAKDCIDYAAAGIAQEYYALHEIREARAVRGRCFVGWRLGAHRQRQKSGGCRERGRNEPRPCHAKLLSVTVSNVTSPGQTASMLRKSVMPPRGLLAIGRRSATRRVKTRIMGAPWATPREFIEVWSRRNQRRRDTAGSPIYTRNHEGPRPAVPSRFGKPPSQKRNRLGCRSAISP